MNKRLVAADEEEMRRTGMAELDRELDLIIIDHNRMAAKVMAEANVSVNDFYSLIVGKLDLAHDNQFHEDASGCKILAEAARKANVTALPEKC
jgi:hypothetical protein